MNITDKFIDEIMLIAETEIPERVVHQVKRTVLDYMAVTYAGAYSKREEFERYLNMSSDEGAYPVLGLKRKTDLSSASLLNGFASHVLELDDGHRFGMLHLGAPVLSALLTIAPKEQLTSAQFIRGVVCGYEVAIRLAMAIQPTHKNKGYHATGTCGTIGAAFAIAAALGFNRDEVKSTLSNAATSASGILEVIDDVSEIKAYNVSSAVLNGIVAARFGRLSLPGPHDILGGKRGFFKTLTGDFKEEALWSDLNNVFEIEKIYVKPYAACRHAHSCIEAALLIDQTENINLNDIEKIEASTYKLAVLGHDHTEIEGISSAKMSTPYGVAAALILKEAGMNAFTKEMVERSDILELSRKVEVVEDEKLTALSPEKRGARVKIYTKDGRVFEKLVEHPLGEPENQISDQALEQKFNSLMEYSGQSPKRIKELANIIWTLENNFDEFLNLL